MNSYMNTTGMTDCIVVENTNFALYLETENALK